jgi:hypothetical protein
VERGASERPALHRVVLTLLLLAPFAGPHNTHEPSLPLLVMASPACATLRFTISSSHRAIVEFPRPECGAGLRMVRGGLVIWDGSTRVLSVPVRILNRSGQTVHTPIRIGLPDTGRFAIPSSGLATTAISVPAADTVYEGGYAVWFVGRKGVQADGVSTGPISLRIHLASPVIRGQLTFDVRTDEVIVGMPALAPNVEPAWFRHDSSWTAVDSLALKRVLAVDFVAGATVAQKQAAIDSVQGTVIGGGPWITTPAEGVYYIHVPGAVTLEQLTEASAILERQAYIASARPIIRMRPSEPGGAS